MHFEQEFHRVILCPLVSPSGNTQYQFVLFLPCDVNFDHLVQVGPDKSLRYDVIILLFEISETV
jgi:hypothetical protein